MKMKRLVALLILIPAVILASCGGGDDEPPAPLTADPQGQIANSVQQTVAAIAVAQTCLLYTSRCV